MDGVADVRDHRGCHAAFRRWETAKRPVTPNFCSSIIVVGVRRMAVTISAVEPHSVCAHRGVRAGEVLTRINGHEIVDILDYQFYATERKLTLTLCDAHGKQRELKIKKGQYEDLGLQFDTYLMDRQRHCANKCIFCFIDQLPRGMRESLYFKDDDSRLSFLFGNYVTLTNLSGREAERIIQMHISPVNISVHTMNPELRVKMMKNPRAGESLQMIKRFADAGIQMNTQLVLCPGLNDGDELLYSLTELGKLYPAVQSIAAVPLGMTKYREGLTELTPYTRESAAAVVDMIEDFAAHFLYFKGTRLAFAADEFYLKAGRKIPPPEAYEDFAQLENGIGLWALLKDEFDAALRLLNEMDLPVRPRRVAVATGQAAFPLLEELAAAVQAKCPALTVQVYAVRNDFFGESITVAGLLTGRDLIAQLKGKELGEELLIPAVMLRREGDLFLDDLTPSDVEKALQIPVTPVPNDGGQLLDAMLGMKA